MAYGLMKDIEGLYIQVEALYIGICCRSRQHRSDRPRTWFPGPLGPYQAWFPGIQLSRDFKWVKVPGTPTESPFCFVSFVGSNS